MRFILTLPAAGGGEGVVKRDSQGQAPLHFHPRPPEARGPRCLAASAAPRRVQSSPSGLPEDTPPQHGPEARPASAQGMTQVKIFDG